MKFIQWIDPSPEDNITSYSKKLILQIDQSIPFSLVGLSFGGMIAAEISNLIPVKKTILISSALSSKQFPWYFRAIKFFRFHKIAPLKTIRKADRILYWVMGIKTPAQKIFFNSIHNKANYKFVKWATREILNWKRTSNTIKIAQIHGTGDKIFPIKNIQPAYQIEGAGHFMIFNNAEMVTNYLIEELSRTCES